MEGSHSGDSAVQSAKVESQMNSPVSLQQQSNDCGTGRAVEPPVTPLPTSGSYLAGFASYLWIKALAALFYCIPQHQESRLYLGRQ